MVNKMKRILASLLVAFLLIGTASASVPDLSGLTADELLDTIRAAQSLLFSEQLVNGVRVPQGTYIIGEDIPAGTYRIEITDGTGFYDLYDKPDGRLLQTGLTGSLYDVTEIGKITLEDGNALKFVNSTFIFYPYTGIFH